MANKTLTLDLLKELCLKYDMQHDAWPDDRYEGMSLYYFVAQTAFGEKITAEEEDLIDEWEEEIRKLEIASASHPAKIPRKE